MPKSTLPTTSQQPLSVAEEPSPRDRAAQLREILDPLFCASENSSSLIPSRHAMQVRGQNLEIAKFLLLGERGGSQPIRVGLFSGFESEQFQTVRLLAGLILQLKASPAATRDFALLAYPVVNAPGFTDAASPLSEFEARYARNSVDPDVQFFQGEFRRWSFDGLISIRASGNSRGLRADVRSEIVAAEVVEPALAAAAAALPLASPSVRIRASDRYARAADYSHGRLSPPADLRPYPFEIELFVSNWEDQEAQSAGLFIAITEILRHYRAMLAHAQNL